MLDADDNTFNRNDGTETHRRVCSAAEIFSKYSNQIRAIIAFHIDDKSKADDIFQQFFISLVHNPIPEHIQKVEKYLYRALANDVIDLCRQTNLYRDNLQRYAEQRRYDKTVEDPQDNLLQAEATREMLRLLRQRLSKREAAVVWQHYGKGLNRTDTARKTDLDKKTVARYLSLARKKMRKFLPQHIGDMK